MVDTILHSLNIETFLKLVDSAEEVTNTGMWVLDVRNNFVFWSKGTYRLHELDENEMLSLARASGFYTDESLPKLNEKLQLAIETKKPVEGEFSLRTAKGNLIYTRNTIKPIVQNGKVIRLFGTITDITERKKYTQQLEQEKDILNAIGDSVIGTDSEGYVIHWNSKAEELFGVKYDDILGKSIADLGYDFDVDSLHKSFAKEGRNVVPSVWDYVNDKGEHVFLSVTMSALRNEEGSITGFIGVSKDITEQRNREKRIRELNDKIHASERKFQALIDKGEDVACIISEAGKIEYISKNVSHVLGLDAKELLGKDLSALCLEHATALREVFEQILKQKQDFIKVEHLAVKANGDEIWLKSAFTNALNDKDVNGVIYNFRNITTRKEAEINHEKARLLAEEMTAMKTNFLATMSHEIRTPLNGIMGIAELIELEATESSIKELVKIQRESGERLMNTLNSILAMTKLEAENAEHSLEQVDVPAVLRQTADLYTSKAALKNIDLILDCDSKATIKANETMLGQCINNLVDNAIKFTDHGSIRISCTMSKKYLKVFVSDTGIGISAEMRERIFEPFWQVQMGQARKYQGTGLGLSIVKRYIEFIGGTIEVEGEPGKGSTFIVSVPVV